MDARLGVSGAEGAGRAFQLRRILTLNVVLVTSTQGTGKGAGRQGATPPDWQKSVASSLTKGRIAFDHTKGPGVQTLVWAEERPRTKLKQERLPNAKRSLWLARGAGGVASDHRPARIYISDGI